MVSYDEWQDHLQEYKSYIFLGVLGFLLIILAFMHWCVIHEKCFCHTQMLKMNEQQKEQKQQQQQKKQKKEQQEKQEQQQ